MVILGKVAAALQNLFGPLAHEVGQATDIIVRQRKFTALTLARTFVLGFLRHPKASDEELARTAVQAGVDVTPQAIAQRHSPKLVLFLKELFVRATQVVVGSDKALAPLLERFRTVIVLDSSTITLPDGLQEESAGCGGNHGGGAAAMKLQVELDLRGGALTHMQVEPGRSPDGATSRQQARRGAGSLRITDLGYFNLAVFAAMTQHSEYFLSRLQFATSVLLAGGHQALQLLSWLAQQRGPFIDHEVVVGQAQRLSCRLIAWRLPAEQANRRRQKLRRDYLSKYNKQPSVERLAWCDWTILLTNVPRELMSPEEAAVLYRARWQVELLFKRWKSQDLVAVLQGSTEVRQMVGVWARLLAALVQHWLVVGSAWGDPTKSLSKVCEAIRDFVGRLVALLDQSEQLERVLQEICRVIAKTCRRNKRSKAGTFELLNDPSRLDFS